MKKTSQLLRHLLNPAISMIMGTQKIAQLVNEHEELQKLYREIRQKHIPLMVSPKYLHYQSTENEYMDAPIIMNELKAPIETYKGFKNPGPDQITTPALRKLSDVD
ncbi:hypothetical protein HPB48_021335 [Haemaphysalis longicornis]|uniref:Uncharacterized protein n=1 Tax=Haemaphysalis longicornis TaxID=44386 RepID=A0A9J6H1N3_HAELO|nr:hypothetical protein HPB48_021335 [Haemaphysalis longicornis]